MTRPTLIIFARAPAIGVGKTRLARDVGRVEAWRLYRAFSARLLRSLRIRAGAWWSASPRTARAGRPACGGSLRAAAASASGWSAR
jgi:hypothetical protein